MHGETPWGHLNVNNRQTWKEQSNSKYHGIDSKFNVFFLLVSSDLNEMHFETQKWELSYRKWVYQRAQRLGIEMPSIHRDSFPSLIYTSHNIQFFSKCILKLNVKPKTKKHPERNIVVTTKPWLII